MEYILLEKFFKFDMRILILLTLVCISFTSNAQSEKKNEKKHKKGITVFSSWGYNRAFFSKSNIHFIGDEYNFTVKNSIAKDRQSPLSANTYLNITNLTIPQYNFCIGIILPNNISISLGQDHMKYVVQQNSIATLNGYIHNHDDFDGEYQNKEIVVTSNFLEFEHTNGLNYVNLNVSKEKKLLETKNHQNYLTGILGIHGGALIPRSDVKLMHYKENDTFHLAGYGVGINTSLRATFLKYCFIKLDNKMGFINMPDVLTRGIQYKDRAKHSFTFAEFFFSFGLQYCL